MHRVKNTYRKKRVVSGGNAVTKTFLLSIQYVSLYRTQDVQIYARIDLQCSFFPLLEKKMDDRVNICVAMKPQIQSSRRIERYYEGIQSFSTSLYTNNYCSWMTLDNSFDK